MKSLFTKQSFSVFLSVSIRKQILAGVILLSMIVNGFVPQSIGNKDSLFMTLSGVASSAVIGMFNECCQTLTDISNRLTKDLYKFLMLGEVSAGAQQKDSENNKPIEEANTSSDMGLAVEREMQEEIVCERDEYQMPLISRERAKEDLYILYERLKVYCSIEGLFGVLFFIVFIISIRNRKGWIDSIKNNVARYRTDLCI